MEFRQNIKTDPIFQRILVRCKVQDFLPHLYEGNKIRSANYSNQTKGYNKVFPPHWFPQFRFILKNNKIVVGRLYAKPYGHKAVSYRVSETKQTITVTAEMDQIPESLESGLIGRDLRSIIEWEDIPEGMIVQSVRFIENENTGRQAKMAHVTNQIELIVPFEWVDMPKIEPIKRPIEFYDGGRLQFSDGTSVATLEELVSKTHKDKVSAKIVEELGSGSPYTARLRIENQLWHDGSTSTPHIALYRAHLGSYATYKLRSMSGSWIRGQDTPDDSNGVTEWMIPIASNTREEIETLLRKFRYILTDEPDGLSAFIGEDIRPDSHQTFLNTMRRHSAVKKRQAPQYDQKNQLYISQPYKS